MANLQERRSLLLVLVQNAVRADTGNAPLAFLFHMQNLVVKAPLKRGRASPKVREMLRMSEPSCLTWVKELGGGGEKIILKISYEGYARC